MSKNTIDKNIVVEMEESFIDYAMSVIALRALPNVCDGLKPVHRRILYVLHQLDLTYDKPHKKCAKIVGEVLGRYHPHGDTAAYEALVRMAQDFSLRYPLINGQGNFGSIDGDGAAAMRYTEARMSKITKHLLTNIDKNTVDFSPNYDESEKEPNVLPAAFPNILANGSMGIAVGMATSIPPHNLKEIIDAIIAYSHNNEITIDEIMEYIPAPDFPTGATIINPENVRNAYQNGVGSITLRSKVEVQDDENKAKLIVTEIPYLVNKSNLIKKISDLVKNETLTSIHDLRDESNRNGIRIVIELKKNAIPEIELNKLYKHSQLETNIAIRLVALEGNVPKTFTLKQIIQSYYNHQLTVLIRATQHDLKKAENKLHILQGLIIAINNIEEIVQIIKNSNSNSEAKQNLINAFDFSEKQATSILDMKLARITNLESKKINDDIKQTEANIKRFNFILDNENERIKIVNENLEKIKDKFGDERRTRISNEPIIKRQAIDLIPNDTVFISLTENGYIKNVKIENYKRQHRGGLGVKSIKTNDNDNVLVSLKSQMHNRLLLFSNKNKVYKLDVWSIPTYSKQAKGIPLINLLKRLEKDEKVISVANYSNELIENGHLYFVTKKGIVKKTRLSEFERIPANGKKALELKENDALITTFISTDEKDTIIGTKNGQAIRFKNNSLRPLGRTSKGVKGIQLTQDDEVIDAISAFENDLIVTLSEKGYAKLTPLDQFRITNRGGKGIKALNKEKAGNLVFLSKGEKSNDIVITTKNGISLRCSLKEISVKSRNTKGVKAITLPENEVIANVALV